MYDVIISGAGPAGSMTAYICAKAGLDVLLLDKATFPREIPCGGGISVRSEKVLRLAGIELPANQIEQELRSLQFMGPDQKPFVFRSSKPLGYTVKRSQFDHYLVKQAINVGAQFVDSCTLQQLESHKDRVTVETERGVFESHLLIGADGVTSTVGRLSGLRKPLNPDRVGVALEVDVPISPSLWNSVLDPSIVYFWFLNIPFGYFWVFPRKDSLSLGVGGMAKQLENVPKLLRGLARTFTTRHGLPPFSIPKIRGRMLLALEYPVLETTNRILLVGDAAGLIDIFTGQGICYALESGFLASKTVIKAVKNNRITKKMLSEYTWNARRCFGEEIRISRTVNNLVHRHLHGFFQVARRLDCIGKVLFDIILGKTDYYRIRRNLLVFAMRLFTFELQNRLLTL
ncbi:MAG: NAD(P)/FAD-dependent oxidoreductase [Candidatus Hermodarchaeota archaeon]|nr:NAD(P)/FAD-dependent oxidoreductase [Candidatus Hermodarchaeota archaeon]